MPTQKTRTNQERLEADIQRDFSKYVGQKKYTADYIFELLGKKYYREPSTVRQIVYGFNDRRRNQSIATSNSEVSGT